MKGLPFNVGFAKRRINPLPEMGPVYRAGYKMGEAEKITGVVDDIFLRCLSIDNGDTRIVILSLDLIGLFGDFTDAVGFLLSPSTLKPENLLVATTHMHSGPDTMGLWGPSIDTPGFNEDYESFLLRSSADAVSEAVNSARPASAFFSFAEKDLGIANFREPAEVNLDLWCIFFRSGGETLGSLISYPAQPELSPRDDDRISGDYPGEACRIMEEKLGGVSLFLLGACGGMEPDGCEKGYEQAHAYGRRLGDELLMMAVEARPLARDTLAVTSREVRLPVENPGFQLMMEAGMIRTSQRPPVSLSKISRVEIGELCIFTLPGESFPGISRGVRETAASEGRTVLFANQVNDSLGYFIPPEQFRSEPTEWAEGHHFTGHEMESLGRKAGEAIRRELQKLASS